MGHFRAHGFHSVPDVTLIPMRMGKRPAEACMAQCDAQGCGLIHPWASKNTAHHNQSHLPMRMGIRKMLGRWYSAPWHRAGGAALWLSCGACSERLASVFASRVALQNDPDVGAEKSEHVLRGRFVILPSTSMCLLWAPGPHWCAQG